MPPLRSRTLILAALIGARLSASSLAAATASPPPPDAIQMLADVTLLDGECRNVEVNFGRAFQAADAMGLRAVDVMPTGPYRAAFEAAARTRLSDTPHDDLCEAVARAYAARVPGILRLR